MSKYRNCSYNEQPGLTEVAATGAAFVGAGTLGYHAVNEGVKAIKRGLGYDQDKPESFYDRSMQAAEDVATVAGAVGGACYLLKMGSGLALEAVGAAGKAYDYVADAASNAWGWLTGKSNQAQPAAAQAQPQPTQAQPAQATAQPAAKMVQDNQQYDCCANPPYQRQFNYNCRRP